MNLKTILDSIDLEECHKACASVARELEAKSDSRYRAVARAGGLLRTLSGLSEIGLTMGSLFARKQTEPGERT